MKSHPNRVAFYCNFFINSFSLNADAGAVIAPAVCVINDMRDFAAPFYKSKQWKRTRELYAASVGWLCEICEQNGKLVPGEIVHHKIHLSPENIDDPSITMNWENLQLVCRDCHAKIHTGNQRRYTIDENGRVVL